MINGGLATHFRKLFLPSAAVERTAKLPRVTQAKVRLFRRMAYIGPRLRELQIIPYIDHTYA